MKTPEKSNLGDTGERNKRGIFDKFSHDTLVYLSLLVNNASDWFPRLKKDDLRQLIPLILAGMTAACQPTRGFEDQPPPSPTPIVEPYHLQPTPELTPISPLELTPTPEPTPIATPGPTISGETLTISDSQLKLKEFDGEEIAQLINASEKGWQVITNDKGKVSFFSGEVGKEPQIVVLAQGPEEYQFDYKNQLWRGENNQVFIPDILLPGGWNEAGIFFLIKDIKDNGYYQVGAIYPPDKVAQISDKSNLEILPDGSGLFVGSPKNYELKEGQKLIRDEDGNLRLTNPDGSYLLMRTSWSQVTSPNQLYQASTFAGPFETQPTLPYPTDEIVQELGITNYQVVDNHYIALQEVVDQQTGETHQYIVAQATINKEGEIGWQRTLPFDVESGPVVPHPQETNPELFDLTRSDAPIPQFVNAMRMAGIEVDPQEVANNLQYQTITGADGEQYVIGTFNIDPNPKKKGETLEGPIPLVIWSEKGGWREILFRDSEKIVGIHIGGMIEKYPNTKQIIRNFSFGTISSTWGETIAEDGVNAPLNFSRYEDFQINYANSFGLEGINGGKYYLNSVIFPQYPPQGFEGLSREEAINYLKQYITDVIRHFKSKGVNTFAVVNEPYHRTGDGREDVLLKVIGPDYVEIAFATARQVAPDAVLVLNETANHDPRQWGGKYVTQTRALIKQLREKGLVDWVGVQGHLAYNQDYPPPSIEQMERIFKSYEAPVLITEADFTLGAVRGQVEQKYLFQADGYYRIIRACLNSGNCVGISFFGGFPDKNSWYEKSLNQHNADPTPWADDSNPKPAYYAILMALLEDVFTSK